MHRRRRARFRRAMLLISRGCRRGRSTSAFFGSSSPAAVCRICGSFCCDHLALLRTKGTCVGGSSGTRTRSRPVMGRMLLPIELRTRVPGPKAGAVSASCRPPEFHRCPEKRKMKRGEARFGLRLERRFYDHGISRRSSVHRTWRQRQDLNLHCHGEMRERCPQRLPLTYSDVCARREPGAD